VTRDPLSSGNLAAPFFLLIAVVANQSVFRLGALPLGWAVLLVASVAFVAWAAPDVRLGAMRRRRLNGWNVVPGAVIVAPLLGTFVLGWNRDFPFSGDHYFHVGQAYRIAYWWMSPPASATVRVPTLDDVHSLLHHPARLLLSRAVALVLLAIVTALIYRRRRPAALLLATLALTGWGLCEAVIFLRYPAGGYFAAMPFLGPAFLLHDVELAGRAANVAAPVLWLFALRPWLVGRWPDLRVLPFGVLLFWQKDVIYFFDTVYLEPWSVTFCLLAVEVLIARGSRGAPLSCLLVGAAAAVKEPAIFALPLVWLAGAPWRTSWREVFALSGAGFAAGAAFVLYDVARNSAAAASGETGRGFHLGLPSEPLAVYGQEFVHRMQAAFAGTSGWLMLVALVALLAAIWWLRSRRLQIACLAATGVGLVLFFLVDKESIAWAGSFRFVMAALPFLAAGTLALGYGLRRNGALMAGAVTLVLQAPSAVNAIGKAAGPITGLNFIENYDAAIFFPMKPLLAEARRKNLLQPNAAVLANAPDPSMRPVPGIPVSYGPPGKLLCECSEEHPAVMGLFVRYTNLDAPFGGVVPSGAVFGPPRDRERLWRAGRALRPVCLAELRRTCGHMLERVEGGEPVAVLGLSR
jgi:hypothetical protein